MPAFLCAIPVLKMDVANGFLRAGNDQHDLQPCQLHCANCGRGAEGCWSLRQEKAIWCDHTRCGKQSGRTCRAHNLLTCNQYLHAQVSGLVGTAWQILTTPEMRAGHCCHACGMLCAIRRAHKWDCSASHSTDDQWQIAAFHPRLRLHFEAC